MGYQPESSLSRSLSDDCCEWEGVDCSLTSSHVIRIFFYYAREEEELPWSPDLSLFANLTELEELHLPGNHIDGLLSPEALCELHNLQQLDISDNSIQNELPLCWGNMPSLNTLKLSKNQFQGNLSTIFSNATMIELLDVSYNHFQGPLAFSSFANLSKLKYLDLSYNQLEVDTETPTWVPSFQIQHLFLASCHLNSRIGHSIPTFLFNQFTLQTLDLSGNFLGGSIPTWMLYNVSFALRLRNNIFVGTFPHLYQHLPSPVVELDISNNYIEGPLPWNINTLLPRIYKFNVSSNAFNGTIPPALGELGNLQHLDLSNNRLCGEIPVDLTKDSPLWYLNLSNNSLAGTLLPQNSSLRQLRWLLLHDNHFVGSLPHCLSKSPSLLLLDARNNSLSGTISDRLPIFAHLGALLLGRNQFEGYIPMHLCEMQYIQFLDLSRNKFTGTIPSCLNNNLFWTKKLQASSWVPVDFTTKGNSYSFRGRPLNLMTGIDLAANQLSGSIPIKIGQLQELRSLNLSHNYLTGFFPESFENLINLESLDLSFNNLTGRIPWEIVRINSLSTFSVAFNNLSGKVHFVQQLSTFTEDSYEGNLYLCGDPLPRKCPEEGDQDVDSDNQDDDKEDEHIEEKGIIDEPRFFYSFVAMSYALGFWSFIFPLFFSKNWRRRYFAAVDEFIDWFLWKLS